MVEAIFTPDVIGALIIESPIVVLAIVHSVLQYRLSNRQLDTVDTQGKTIREMGVGQTVALKDATVTAPDLNDLASVGL